jgi:hypothetical protein
VATAAYAAAAFMAGSAGTASAGAASTGASAAAAAFFVVFLAAVFFAAFLAGDFFAAAFLVGAVIFTAGSLVRADARAIANRLGSWREFLHAVWLDSMFALLRCEYLLRWKGCSIRRMHAAFGGHVLPEPTDAGAGHS